jgi:hypothetical protein
VETWAPAPAVYDVAVGWYFYEEGQVKERLPAFDASGAPLELVTLGKVKVKPESYAAVEVPNRLDADLGGQITLLGYEADKLEVAPGEAVDVTLYWAAQAPLSVDYTVFLHLAAPAGPPYAQADGQPQHGAYPTSFWDAGEVVRDPLTIVVPADLPPGEYPLLAGMYLLETGERLLWLAPDGSVQGDAVPLVMLTVRARAP